MRRIWIIGNGPSLHRTPLAEIKEETVGLNRIHLIYGQTKWRPTYYFCTDLSRVGGFSMSQVEQWNADLQYHATLGYPMYTRDDLWSDRLHKNLQDRIQPLLFCRHFSPMDGSDPAPTAWHLPMYCRYGGSMLSAIQWAAQRYDEIIIVGADLGYGDGTSRNHFSLDYAPTDSYTKEQARWFNGVLRDAHAIARRECNGRGVKIVNATVGGNLTAYPRVDISTLLA